MPSPLLLRLSKRAMGTIYVSAETKNEWNQKRAFIIGRFIEEEKCIRHTLQFKSRKHKQPQQGTVPNVQPIGFLQVIWATCHRRREEKHGSLWAHHQQYIWNHWFFIVGAEKRWHSALSWHMLFLFSYPQQVKTYKSQPSYSVEYKHSVLLLSLKIKEKKMLLGFIPQLVIIKVMHFIGCILYDFKNKRA